MQKFIQSLAKALTSLQVMSRWWVKQEQQLWPVSFSYMLVCDIVCVNKDTWKVSGGVPKLIKKMRSCTKTKLQHTPTSQALQLVVNVLSLPKTLQG